MTIPHWLRFVVKPKVPPPFPIEIKQCPICHCKDTLCRLGCADEPTIPKGTFVSMEKKVTPIQDATRLSSLTIRVLMRHYDTCANCGLDYCVKVEIQSMPAELLMKAMGMPSIGVPKR